MTHTITEQRDTLGRSTGYVYAKNDIPQQQTSIGYGADGRIASAGFTHQGEHKEFSYSYLPGTHLLHTLTHPNGITLTQSYDATRDQPTQMDYSRADALVVQRAYTYDLLGRPTARNLARYGTQTSDTFGYNTRSELTTAHVNSADYSYAYDAIGNRTSATEAGTRTAYTANKLNQYTAEGGFRPTFDADGNQTLIKTSTGTWSVTYNAKNRPVLFAKSDGSVTVECTYDTMGRRATKKVTTNGSVTEHRRFLYRGYLQIACCDLTRAYTPALWFITWDPTQPTATRPLAIQKNGTWYTYGWDLTKNICETYRTDGRIDLAYTYTPYGECTPAHTYDHPLRWSSEYHDTELGLIYYNYRHYNPAMGRWMGRDIIDEPTSLNTYAYVANKAISHTDLLGREDGTNKLTIESCLDLSVSFITIGFWGRSESDITDGATIYLRKGFTFIIRGTWKESAECQRKRKDFFRCFPYQVFAQFTYSDYTWKSGFTNSEFKTIYGLVDRTEISMAQAAFGNGGHSNLYVTSGGFSVTDYQLRKNGSVSINILQAPGGFESELHFTVIFDSDMSRFKWDSHRIEYK